ncbi:MAG: hypothetical protein ABI690_23125 [Chloroflexota bacterium]
MWYHTIMVVVAKYVMKARATRLVAPTEMFVIDALPRTAQP